MSISLLEPPIFQPNGTYTRDEAEIVAEGHALWAGGHVSLYLPPSDVMDAIRMPRMSVVVAVRDAVLRLCGIKRNGDEYCSCAVESRDPRRCAHLWALTCVLQHQRPRTIKQRLGLESPNHHARTVSRPNSPESLWRPPCPQQVTALRIARARSSLDPYGLGVVELLARSNSFVATLRRAFQRVAIETLTVSCLAQILRNVENDLVGDYVNILTAFMMDGILRDRLPPEPAELILCIVRHCDAQAGGTALNDLLQWKAEASVRCLDCNLLSFGRDMYTHWRQSVYTWVAGARGVKHAPSLERLLQCALFDAAHTKCRRCKAMTPHIVRHVPVTYGNLLLVRVVTPRDREATNSFYIPPTFRDKGLGHTFNLVGFLIGGERGHFNTIVMEDGELVELVAGIPKPQRVRGLSGPPVLILYECDDD